MDWEIRQEWVESFPVITVHEDELRKEKRNE